MRLYRVLVQNGTHPNTDTPRKKLVAYCCANNEDHARALYDELRAQFPITNRNPEFEETTLPESSIRTPGAWVPV